jgi:RsiW-degrading membrane proteinase PrsW (M82 family)
MMNLSRQPAYWLFVALVFAGVLIVGYQQLTFLAAYPEAWFLSILLLAAVAIPVGLIIYRFDQFEPEPASLIAIAVIWGAVVALSFAAIANSSFLTFLQHVLPSREVDSWGAALVAPIDEEFYKGAGLVMIFLIARDEINGLMDGLVYGAMIGLGFQVMENIQYFVHAAAQSGSGQIGPVISTFFVRVLVAGLYSHMLFTGLLGFGFAYFVTRRSASWALRAGVFALFIALAWGAHFVWNSPWLDSLMAGSAGTFVLALIIKGLPFLVLLLLLGIFARRREEQAFSRLMAEEVGGDVVTQEEFRILRSGRRRRAALRRMKRQKGSAARRMLKRLQREQINLALFHTKVETPGHPSVEAQRDKVRQLKAQLAALG